VWLDRGELDKLIDRGSTQHNSPPTASTQRDDRVNNARRRDDDDDDDDDDRQHVHYDSQQPRHRKKSWLGDMFDF